jgi:hypothetical protein
MGQEIVLHSISIPAERITREVKPIAPSVDLTAISPLTEDELAKTAHFPHNKIGYSIIAQLQQELGSVGYEMILFITPTPRYSDHHTLGVMRNSQLEVTLSDRAADALLRAFAVVSNPYRGKP